MTYILLKSIIDDDFTEAYKTYGCKNHPNKKDFINDYIDILNSDLIEYGVGAPYTTLYKMAIENYEYMADDNKRRAIINYTKNYLEEEYK